MLEPVAPRTTVRDAGAAMPDPEVRERPVRRTFTAEDKLRIVEQANATTSGLDRGPANGAGSRP
jgi:hypothetical protein